MMNVIAGHSCTLIVGVQKPPSRARAHKSQNSGDLDQYFPCRGLIFSNIQSLNCRYWLTARKYDPLFASTLDDGLNEDNSEDGEGETGSSKGEDGEVDNKLIRENLERIVGADDSAFSGIELATLIRNKFGKSYDVQLIKKEFMGRNLLALNVMWKYMEQRSFPLTEEEYLLRLDDIANTLKCWGAVSHIRYSLANLKERPRIGKAVSIFIDMDESGGRSNEWIYK